MPWIHYSSQTDSQDHSSYSVQKTDNHKTNLPDYHFLLPS